MSTNNASPVRDWLLKKYEKALRTIWEQTNELQDMRMHNSSLVGQLDAREQRHRAELQTQQRMSVAMDSITVVLRDEGLEIPLNILFKSSSPNGLEVHCVLPNEIEVDTGPEGEPETAMDAINSVLDSDSFKLYQSGEGSIVTPDTGIGVSGSPTKPIFFERLQPAEDVFANYPDGTGPSGD